MNIAQIIIDRISSNGGVSDLDLKNNIQINEFIEYLVNELKPSYLVGDGPDWDAKVLVRREQPLLQNELKNIISILLSSEPKLNYIQLGEILNQRRIPGLQLDITRTISEEDKNVEFGYSFKELNYIIDNIIYANKGTKNKIFQKVICPFYKYLKEEQNKSVGSYSRVEVPDEIINKMSDLLKHKLPKGLDSNIVSQYCIYNIFNLNNPVTQRNLLGYGALQDYKSNNIFSRFKRQKEEYKNVRNIIDIQSKSSYASIINQLNKNLTPILDGVSAQIYMNSRDLKGKSPEEIEQILQKGYSLHTKNNSQDITYKVDENGYRTVNVGFGNVDVLLHRNGDNIKKAMMNFSSSISELLQSAPNMSDEEYIKEVAKLHFRYISIHPFRDSNGRTGRNIVNLLLSQREKMFKIDVKDKERYLSEMNNMRSQIPLREYLKSLVDNPNQSSQYEEPACAGLAQFITKNTHDYAKDITIHEQGQAINIMTKGLDTKPGHSDNYDGLNK